MTGYFFYNPRFRKKPNLRMWIFQKILNFYPLSEHCLWFSGVLHVRDYWDQRGLQFFVIIFVVLKLCFLFSHVLFTLKSNLWNIPQLTDDCHEKWHETQVYQLEIHLLDLSKIPILFWNYDGHFYQPHIGQFLLLG